MALRVISKIEEKSADGIILDVNNGDLKVLKEIKEKWGFKSEADALRYALSVLRQAENQVVYIDREGGKVGLAPSEELIEKKQ